MGLNKLWRKLFKRNSEADEIALHVAGATVRHRSPFENIEVPGNEMPLSQEFIDKWAAPFYMSALYEEDEATIRSFAEASKEVNIEIVRKLLGDFNWRTRIAGAYFAAINNYKELVDIIGKLLLKSEVCYAGRGYCLALATFGNGQSKEYLVTYLNHYLERKDLWFDQADAYSALEYLDKEAAAKLIDKWNFFIADKEHLRHGKTRLHFPSYMSAFEKIRKTIEENKKG